MMNRADDSCDNTALTCFMETVFFAQNLKINNDAAQDPKVEIMLLVNLTLLWLLCAELFTFGPQADQRP